MSDNKIINLEEALENSNPRNLVALSNFTLPAAKEKICTEFGTPFTIKYSIPYEELLTHMQWAIMLITDDNGYISEPVKIAVEELILCAAFTNLDFRRLELSTIKQAELYEMYDIVKKCGLVDAVQDFIDPDQLSFFNTTLAATLVSILNYRNSAAGIVELLSVKNEEMKTRFDDVLESFNDPEKTANVSRLAELMQSQANRV